MILIFDLGLKHSSDDFDIEFVEKVSESIAASLYATKINARTALLQDEYNKLVIEKNEYNEALIEREKEIKLLKRTINKIKEEKSILSIK